MAISGFNIPGGDGTPGGIGGIGGICGDRFPCWLKINLEFYKNFEMKNLTLVPFGAAAVKTTSPTAKSNVILKFILFNFTFSFSLKSTSN